MSIVRKVFISVEILIIYFSVLVVSFFFNPEDPLYVKSNGINLYTFALMITTLFYGMWVGLFGLVILYVFIYFYYEHFNYIFFLSHLLVVLIGSIFNFVYNRKLESFQEQNYFLKDRLDSLTKNFFLLKLSYENLEKNYLLKPYSIRDILKNIRGLVLNDFDKAVSELFTFIVDTFSVEKGSLYIVEGGKFKQVQFSGYPSELDQNDFMVKTALEKKEIVYISDLPENLDSKYIAVIPILDSDQNINALMTISQMPFVKFNQDNILTISLFLSYFFDDLHVKDKLKQVSLPVCDFDFNKELYKLSLIKIRYNKDSTVVIINVKDPEISAHINEFIGRRIRSTDVYCIKDIIIVLLPLTSLSGAESFINRIKEDIYLHLPKEYVESIEYSMVPLRSSFKENVKKLEEQIK